MVVFGDEITSIVLDVGQSVTRLGYSGEDSPKHVFPSAVGQISEAGSNLADKAESTETAMEVEPSAADKKKKRNLFGDLNINYHFKDMEVRYPLKNSIIEDWDLLEALWAYAFSNRLREDVRELPVLLVESVFNMKETREKLVELMFEKFEVPGTFLSKSSVLSSFAAGKPTGIVLDCGAGSTSVVPIFDGYALKGASFKQSTGGNFLSNQVLHMIEQEMNVPVRASYEVLKKSPVDLCAPADFCPRSVQVTESFRDYFRLKVADDFKESVCQVSEAPFNATDLAIRPPKYFEFPDGYNMNIGTERYRIGEAMFNPKAYAVPGLSSFPENEELLGVHELVQKSVFHVDVDIRPTLFNNVIVVGGGSLMNGFADRLYTELVKLASASRIRIQASTISNERKYSSWIGGSILASLGSFQQLWMSKAEYQEHGAPYVSKKCQ